MIRTSSILTTLATAAAFACGSAAFAQGGGSGAPSNNTANSGPKAGAPGTSGTRSNAGTMNRNTGTQVVTPAQGPNNPSPAGPNGVGTTGPIDPPAGTGRMTNDTGRMADTDRMATDRPMRRRAPRADRN